MGSHFSMCPVGKDRCSIFGRNGQRLTLPATFSSTIGNLQSLLAVVMIAGSCRVALRMPDNTLAQFCGAGLHGIDAPERKPSKQSEHRDLAKKAAMRARAVC